MPDEILTTFAANGESHVVRPTNSVGTIKGERLVPITSFINERILAHVSCVFRDCCFDTDSTVDKARTSITRLARPGVKLKVFGLVVVQVETVVEDFMGDGRCSHLHAGVTIAASHTHPDLAIINNAIFCIVVVNVPAPRIISRRRCTIIEGRVKETGRATRTVNVCFGTAFHGGRQHVNSYRSGNRSISWRVGRGLGRCFRRSLGGRSSWGLGRRFRACRVSWKVTARWEAWLITAKRFFDGCFSRFNNRWKDGRW